MHPREVDEHFAHGTVTNYWGGSSSPRRICSTRLHYRGAAAGGAIATAASGSTPSTTHRAGPVGCVLDAASCSTRSSIVVVHVYAPLPAASLAWLVNRLRYAVPQWQGELKRALRAREGQAGARARRRRRLVLAGGESVPRQRGPTGVVRFLAPFDPVVWDRRRFELLWGWAYRFEAYTPAPKRKLGYYALPLLWRDRVIGWGNLSTADGQLRADIGYVSGRAPRIARLPASSMPSSSACESFCDSRADCTVVVQ